MELQGLQEALKVEIQCHQDGELKRQLHDRRITALSDKQNQTLCKGLNELQNGQKLAVRSCPVGSTKPLSLIKPPSQGIAISVVPAKAPVSMVTAHINGQKAASSEPLQTSPINLQTGGRVAAASVHAFSSRRAAELPPSQMLGTLTAVPIKVPQVSSLHRLAGQAATVLPQVRPKTQIPDSLPHSPCLELQPVSLQRATAVVSPKSQGATLPTANSTFSPEHQPNGQSGASPPAPAPAPAPAPPHGPSGGPDSGGPLQHTSAVPGVAYAIIAASPATGNGVSAVSEAVKVIIIQPQAPSSTEGSPGAHADLPSQEAPPPKSPSQKKDEDPEKIAFMVALGLVTTEHLEEIQTKRQERKRRSTANPAYSGLFEPERKRLPSHYLNSSLFLSARDSEDFCWKEDLEHDEHCAVCKEDGELQPCHNCPRAFHPNCLHPPLKTPPRGPWYCPKCQKKVLNKENMSWPQNFVQSYVTHKTGGEAAAVETKHRAEEGVRSPGGTRREAQRYAQTVYGPERAAAGAAERHSGFARTPQSSHQVDPTRPAHPGHHDDHRHHRRRLPALPVLDQTHQHRCRCRHHRRRRRHPGPLGHTPAAEEPRPHPGRHHQLAPPPPRAVMISFFLINI